MGLRRRVEFVAFCFKTISIGVLMVLVFLRCFGIQLN